MSDEIFKLFSPVEKAVIAVAKDLVEKDNEYEADGCHYED